MHWFPYLPGLHNGQNASMVKFLLLFHTTVPCTNDDVLKEILHAFSHFKLTFDKFWFKEILHAFNHFKFTFGKFWFFGLKNQTRPLLLIIWDKKWKITIHFLLFINYYSPITVYFSLFIGTVHYTFYAYLRGNVPYVKPSFALEPEFSLGLLLSFRTSL